jgi:hypothetical protein
MAYIHIAGFETYSGHSKVMSWEGWTGFTQNANNNTGYRWSCLAHAGGFGNNCFITRDTHGASFEGMTLKTPIIPNGKRYGDFSMYIGGDTF